MAENYIVSARKYRPQTFDTVVGQHHITTTLKNAIRHNHLAHAYLFCGPRGVGKTTCARILARTINCENPTADMEACGVCNTCQSFKNNTSFNVFELDAASNNSVDDIRNLTDQVRFAPQQGKYKIYIIDEVHMLSAAAFNAFLKTLEEPPSYAIFILATTEKHKILPTILSRCQIFDFKRITTHDIVDHLHGIATKEGVVAQEAALHVIAQKSEGCMRDALSMLDRIVSFTNGMLTYNSTMEHLNILDADFYFSLTDLMLSQDVSGTLLQLDNALERGFEGDVILEGLAEHMRNLLLCKDGRMAKLLDVPNEHKPFYHEKANQAPPSFILSALNVINESELNYKNANNKRLHIEMCLIRLCYLLQAVSADTPPAAIPSPEVKKNLSEAVPEPVKSYIPPPVPAHTPPPQPVPQQPKPQPAAKPGPDVSATSQKTTLSGMGMGKKSRITRDLLADIEEAVNNAHIQEEENTRELTADWIKPFFEEFKEGARSAGKHILHAQLSMMLLEVYPPDEIRIISVSPLNNNYALEQRHDMIDFFRKKTGKMVRVKVELREDESAITNEQPTVLSKQEVFDVMAQKNPALRKLKDDLNLQIEW